MDGGHSQAAGLMRAQRYGDAIPLLIAACGVSEAGRPCWADLGRCLLETDQIAGFLRLVDQRQAIASDGLRLYHDCLAGLLTAGRHALLLKVIGATPRNSALYIVGLYLSGLLACQGPEARRGIEEIKLAAQVGQTCAALFQDDPMLSAILYEGDVLEPFETIARLEATDRSQIFGLSTDIAPTADFVAGTDAPRIDAPCIFLAGCSEPYLDRFGAGLVAALDRTELRTVLHFHVADPSPKLAAKIASLKDMCRHLDVRYSTEIYGHAREGYSRASFYACSRLIRLPEIFAHYDRDIMMWDMDASGVHDVDRLVAAMKGFDLGYFEMGNQRPPLICHLAVAYYANTAAMRRAASLISTYAVWKLHETPYWLLDQSSVFCVSRYLREIAGLRINDFTGNPGGAFERYFDIEGSASEKQGMRNRAGGASPQ
ncbi:MAG TPA: hypothetical protein VG328_26580 [Stellaceae bacterium]|jgi:hypothetical protein|nr:hypothetical protein [Stellaceae bacterium]